MWSLTPSRLAQAPSNDGWVPRAAKRASPMNGCFSSFRLFCLVFANVPLSKTSHIPNPDASGKWGNGLPLFMGVVDDCGHFIIYHITPRISTLFAISSWIPWPIEHSILSINEYFLCPKPYFRSSKQNKQKSWPHEAYLLVSTEVPCFLNQYSFWPQPMSLLPIPNNRPL